MKIAVTGSYSYSGKYITHRLLERGEEVITLTGHPDRPDPFNGQVKAYPLDFDNEDGLAQSLTGVNIFYNTYWVRFNHATFTHMMAVDNTRVLFDAAREAGVRRVQHGRLAHHRSEIAAQ